MESYEKSVDALPYGDHPVVERGVTIDASQTLERGALLGRKNQIFTLTQGASGGSFKLLVDGEESGTIAYNASAATVQTALEALEAVESGDVACSGGALGTNPVVVQFKGRLAGITVELAQNGASLTGGTLTLADTSAGNEGRYVASDPGATDGSQSPVAILAEDVTTGVGETAEAVVYEAGHFNSNAVDIGDHNLGAVTNVLRPLGIHLHASATNV